MWTAPVTAGPVRKFVTANGVRLSYLEWGRPDSPKVLMQHGIGLCAEIWNWTARRLASEFNVLSFDLRGHGDSEKPDGGYTFEEIGRDLSAAASTLGLERPAVVGHSAGGSAAVIAHALTPGVLGQTVIIDSRVGGSRALSSRPDLLERPARTRRKRTIWDSRDAIYEAYRGRSVFRSWEEAIFADYVDGGTRQLADGRLELKCPPEVEAVFYEQRAGLNSSPYVLGLRGDFLILLGNYPGAQTLDDPGILEFVRETGGARVIIAPQGSHFLPMEQPQWVLGEIVGFLRQRQLGLTDSIVGMDATARDSGQRPSRALPR